MEDTDEITELETIVTNQTRFNFDSFGSNVTAHPSIILNPDSGLNRLFVKEGTNGIRRYYYEGNGQWSKGKLHTIRRMKYEPTVIVTPNGREYLFVCVGVYRQYLHLFKKYGIIILLKTT